MSKSGKSSEQVVLERRLKPIYDAIDTGNNKKAVQEADKVLKKHPLTYCAKALKALAFIRSERLCEAVPIISELEKELEKKAVMMDENALQAICHCLKEASLPERIPRIYEHLVQRFPKNEGYMTHLFMAYARLRDYKNQQKTSMALYKEFPKQPYYFWTITSVYMQALCDPTLGPKMFWPLAEKMIKKMIDTQPITSEAVDLYLSILEGMGKPAEALKAMESPLVRHYQRPKPFIFRRMITLLLSCGDHRIVTERLMNMLSNEPDEWTHWESLFECTFNEYDKEGDEAQRKALLDRVISFTCSSAQRAEEEMLRAPMIARMALLHKVVDRNYVPEGELGKPLEHFKTYVRLLHEKPCCYIDIRKFLRILGSDDRDHLVTFLTELLNEVPDAKKGIVVLLRERIRRALGFHENLTVAEARELADELLSHMVARCQDDQVTASGLTLMIVHLLWDIYLQSSDPVAFWEILSLLEYTRIEHPADGATKLLLMRMYAHVGGVHIVENLQAELDIKYVQKDSMSYYLLPLQEHFGSFHRAIFHFTQLSVYFDQTDREISECIVQAYKNSAFTKVPSLVNLHKRCESSITSLYGDVSNRLISACFAMNDMNTAVEMLNGDPHPVDWEALCDNRDLNVIDNLNPEPTQKKIKTLQDETFKEMIDATKLRQLLCKFVAGLRFANTTPENMEQKRIELTTHLDYCMETYPENRERKPRRDLQAPTDMRLGQFAHSGIVQFVMKMMEGAVELIRIHDKMEHDTIKVEDAEELTKQAMEQLPKPEDLSQFLRGLVPSELNAEKPFFVHDLLYQCGQSALAVALGGIVLQILESIIRNTHNLAGNIAALNPKKSNKKEKKEKAPYVAVFQDLRDPLRTAWRNHTGLLNELSLLLDKEGAAEKLFPKIPKEHWKREGSYEALTSLHDEVPMGVISGYQSGIKDLLFSSSGHNGAHWIM
ncbi:hypothetical protein QR680_012499 [Steinernema hermaphroditum]|uniref:N-terminal acetyltransferase B complex subunit MDM20 homolog n=1 Tax=Steinernema hermaphroditum TaxID=289476 RepID=A0AA39LZX9_9BILA|nr:hypothetical protein QR680_012499 [Steinernema hermaphroditum]